MRVCLVLFALAAAGTCLAEGPSTVTVRGTLALHAGKPALEAADHKFIFLDGDELTRGVLNDERLAGFEVEAKGHYTAPDHFLIDPIHTRAMLVRDKKDGRFKLVTYWCATCSIRTYTPGPCWCCQQETTLDLRDPDSLSQ